MLGLVVMDALDQRAAQSSTPAGAMRMPCSGAILMSWKVTVRRWNSLAPADRAVVRYPGTAIRHVPVAG